VYPNAGNAVSAHDSLEESQTSSTHECDEQILAASQALQSSFGPLGKLDGIRMVPQLHQGSIKIKE
jgi:hypothetical protein